MVRVLFFSIALLASKAEAVDFTATVTDYEGTIVQVSDFTAVYEPAEWVKPPKSEFEALSLVLQTATGSERLIEIPFAEIKRIDFDPVYSDPKLTGSVPAWYPVRIARRDGSLVTVAHGPLCVISDAAGRIVESIPLSDEYLVYDRSNRYGERGYVFRRGTMSGQLAIGGGPVAKSLLLTGFAGSQAGRPFHIKYGPVNLVRSIEFK